MTVPQYSIKIPITNRDTAIEIYPDELPTDETGHLDVLEVYVMRINTASAYILPILIHHILQTLMILHNT